MFFTAYDLCSLRLFQHETEGKTIFPDVLTECYKTVIKFLANPGLAGDQLENPMDHLTPIR